MVQMADGIISIATVIMAGAIRKVSVEHGLDPRDFILFSYGGGGPLHSSALAHELSIQRWSFPPSRETFSAIGMLLADARIDTSKTFVGILDDKSVPKMAETFATLEKEAQAALASEFGTSDVFFERHAEMRYRGQRHNIKVPVSGLKDQEAIRAAFERDYKRPLRPRRRQSAGRISSAASVRFARLKQPEIARLPRAATPARKRRRTRRGLHR
jgi:N-methylhydantoinase A